ncbi:hypothetical protein HK405_000380, partial [Cladochytrium tenue]
MSAVFVMDPPKSYRREHDDSASATVESTASTPNSDAASSTASTPTPPSSPPAPAAAAGTTRAATVRDVFTAAPQLEREFAYAESGVLAPAWPTAARAEVPLFERLSEQEEASLGSAGVRKQPVGKLVMIGTCTYGCAKVRLRELRVYSAEGRLVWEQKSKGSSKIVQLLHYRLRITVQDGRVLVGNMLAFDKHMNLVLSECDEYRRIKSKPAAAATASGATASKSADREEKRALGLVILRGETIVSISVEAPPPPSDEARAKAGAPVGSNAAAGGPGVARPAGR